MSGAVEDLPNTEGCEVSRYAKGDYIKAQTREHNYSVPDGTAELGLSR